MKKFKVIMILFTMIIFLIHPVTASASVKINKSKLTLYVGDSTTLKVSGITKSIAWTSSKKSVATVTKNGKVTAIDTGNATIKAKVDGKTYKCDITVKSSKKGSYTVNVAPTKSDKEIQNELVEKDFLDKLKSDTMSEDEISTSTKSNSSSLDSDELQSLIDQKKNSELDEWISENVLSSEYNIYVSRTREIYIINSDTGKKIYLSDMPNALEKNVEYSSNDITYKYDDGLYFKTQDLIDAGLLLK